MAMEGENKNQTLRLLAYYPPSMWGYSFASLSSHDSEFESYTREVQVLKEKIKIMFVQPAKDYPKNVFNKFKDKDGGFKKTITRDVKGLLSLYEATFLSIRGEDILDEALAFTRQHLETLIPELSPRVADHIRKALRQPNHHQINRVEAREYIDFYEGEESRDEFLLKFAKLDFIRLQLLYKKELASVSRWWKDLNLAEKLPYTRDRIAESYMWAIGIHFEPHYAFSRLMVAKFIQLLTLIDDTYDAYATIDELHPFTAAIERWNIGEINNLPDYMKVLYEFILNFFDEIENYGHKTTYAKVKLKEMVKGYYVEAQWFNKGYVPPFDEFMRNGLFTSGHGAIPAISFIGMENIVGNKEYEWVESSPKMIKAVKSLSRLINDITKREDEKKKSDGPTGVDCYVKEYGVSREEAIEEIQKMCEKAWKDMNEGYMETTHVSRKLLKYYLYLARTLEFIYKKIDYFTDASSMKQYITSLFLSQLVLD